MRMLFNEIERVTRASVLSRGREELVTSVCIDSRSIRPGDLFIAIKGPHFDGHDFIDDAVRKGAIGVVMGRGPLHGRQWKDVWALQVNDTVEALGDIAAAWRKKCDIVCIGITGSNGKSTTKEMIAAGLASFRKVIKTDGNFNNLIGLPLQVLRDLDNYEVAVLEMGMNAKGEIRRLTEIASPDIGVITNVNPAHLEKLHTVENVAMAKGELFETMRQDGTVIINSEDPWCMELGRRYGGKRITFGMQNDCDVRFGRMMSEGLERTDLTFYVKGREYSMRLPVPGVHNVMNALAAISVGVALKIAIPIMITGIERFSAMKMRMERIQLPNGVQVVCDCYNANPSSMLAALRTVSVAKRAGRFIAVLGEMLELGESAAEKHRELGENAAGFGVNKLFVIGEHARDVVAGAVSKGMAACDAVAIPDMDRMKREVLSEIRTGDVVLIKGSRGMKMEEIAEHLKGETGV